MLINQEQTRAGPDEATKQNTAPTAQLQVKTLCSTGISHPTSLSKPAFPLCLQLKIPQESQKKNKYTDRHCTVSQ